MPISPEKQKLYPGGSLRSKEWQAIREQVRARSGDKCEGCGLGNSALIMRSGDGTHYFIEDSLGCGIGWMCLSETGEKIEYLPWHDLPEVFDDSKVVQIVLTVAHLHENDEATTDIDRLRHWCQKCHNQHDATMRAGNARKTREARSAQQSLFDAA